MIMRLAAGQQTFHFVKAIRWRSIEMGISKTYIFLSRHIICLFLPRRRESKDALSKCMIRTTSISHCIKNMISVCGLVLPLRKTNPHNPHKSRLRGVIHKLLADDSPPRLLCRNSLKHLNLHKTAASSALAVCSAVADLLETKC